MADLLRAAGDGQQGLGELAGPSGGEDVVEDGEEPGGGRFRVGLPGGPAEGRSPSILLYAALT